MVFEFFEHSAIIKRVGTTLLTGGELCHEAVFEWEPTLDDAINMLSGRFQYDHVDVDFWVTWAHFDLARVFSQVIADSVIHSLACVDLTL